MHKSLRNWKAYINSTKKMSTQETIQKTIQETENSKFFNQRLRYYIQGAKQCLSWIKESQEEANNNEDEGINNLIKDLQKEADTLWPNSVERQERDGSEEQGSKLDEKSVHNLESTSTDLEEELKREQKRNRVLRKFNLKLKKKNNTLFKSLKQIKLAFSGYLKLAKNNSPKKPEKTSKFIITSSELKEQKPSKTAPKEEKDQSLAQSVLKPPKKTQNKAIQAKQEKKLNNSEDTLIKKSSAIDDSKIIKDLHERFIKSSEKRIQNMQISVQNTLDPSEQGLIGGRDTLLALKDVSSCLVGTSKKGIKLVELGSIKYKVNMSSTILDIIYAENLDCYFLLDDALNIYRKNIDERPPSIFMKIDAGLQVGKSLQYSNLHDKLVICNNKTSISVINVHTKEIEIDLRKKRGDGIAFFKLFGDKEDRVMCGTTDGILLFARLDYSKKRGLINSYTRYDLRKERNEMFTAIAFCSKNEYVLMEIGRKKGQMKFSSRTLIAKVAQDKLEILAKIDHKTRSPCLKYALECIGYDGCHLLWVALTKEVNSKVKIYNFETDSLRFRELDQKSIPAQDSNPLKITKLGQYFYYCGNKGQIRRVAVCL